MEAQERTVSLLMELVSSRVSAAFRYTCRCSVYSEKTTRHEISTAQGLAICLFHGLLSGDRLFCLLLAELARSVEQARSPFLEHWLREDFRFPSEDIAQVEAEASRMEEELQLPPGLRAALLGLRRWNSQTSDQVDLDENGSAFVELGTVEINLWTEDFNKIERIRAAENDVIILITTKGNVINKNNNREEKSINLKVKPNGLITEEKIANGKKLVSMNTVFGKLKVRSDYKRQENVEEIQTNVILDKHYGRQASLPALLPKFQIGSYVHSEEIQKANNSRESYSSRVIPFSSLEGQGRRRSKEYYSVDESGKCLLHKLAQFGRTAAVQMVLDEGAKVDVPDFAGKTPLHWAAEYDRTDTVRMLLNRGAAVNARTYDGRTPLSFAPVGENSGTWALLASRGATVYCLKGARKRI